MAPGSPPEFNVSLVKIFLLSKRQKAIENAHPASNASSIEEGGGGEGPTSFMFKTVARVTRWEAGKAHSPSVAQIHMEVFIGYCSNTNWALRFRCEEDNVYVMRVQPRNNRVLLVEPRRWWIEKAKRPPRAIESVL